jgi:kinesin family protein 5
MGKDKGHSACNVRVVCRCRPINNIERSRGGEQVAVKMFEQQPEVVEVEMEDTSSKHNFDRCFGMDSTQKQVYEDSVFPLIDDVLNGYNATVFAYGQTGTGKTHTMEGSLHDEEQQGIIPRSVNSIFEGVSSSDETLEFTIKVSYVEIYMEKIRDLLDDTKVKNNLTVREDKVNGVYIAGVTEEYVTSQEELLSLMHHGATNRAVAATGMNEGSSRSHSVFTITINQRNLVNATQKAGKLVLVDLAGSEMVKKTSASGQQLEEAKTINKSLSALGQVINALTDAKIGHIPYRDSKLTRVLQDSLGGNSKTVLIIAISPSVYNGMETLSTIRFGSRAKSITNKVTVNATRSVEELETLLLRAEKAIDMQSALIASLQSQLAAGGGGSVDDGSVGSSQDGGEGLGDGRESESDNRRRSNSGTAGGMSAGDKALMAQLQEDLNALHQELEDEKADHERVTGELEEMTGILRGKEKLLGEAGELLHEARRHYESQRERCELLVREKTDLSRQLETVKNSSGEDLERIRFDLEEARNSMDTIRAENDRMRREIEEMSGDGAAASSRNNNEGMLGAASPGSSAPPRPPPRDSVATPDGGKGDSRMRSRSSLVGAAAGDSGISAHALSVISSPLPTADQRLGDAQSASEAFASLLTKHNITGRGRDAVQTGFEEVARGLEERILQYEARSEALEKLSVASNKRVKDVEVQRERLVKDLSLRTESAVALKVELDALLSAADTIKNQQSGRSGDSNAAAAVASAVAASEAIREKQETHSRSLQQRLEQLVAVHRQLLRKYATLELEGKELGKKVALRDDRIKLLEAKSKGSSDSIRQQSERHVAELTNLREQIALMRAEHHQRIEQQQHEHHHHHHHRRGSKAAIPKSLRGGTSSGTDTGDGAIPKVKSLRGGGFSVGGNGDVLSPGPSSSAGMGSPITPGGVTSSGFAALGDMLSKLGAPSTAGY